MRSRPVLVALVALFVASAGCLSGFGSGEDEPLGPQGEDGNRTNETGNGSNSSSSNGTEDDQGNRSEGNGTGSGDRSDRNGTDGGEDDASEHPPWPSPEDATIRPGVQITLDGAQCTSNFLFRTPDNETLMLGVAAHCFAEGASTNTDGCDDDNQPAEPGTKVNIQGASNPGVLVYSSWWTMQRANASGAICQANDFALVAIADEDRSAVHPAMMHYGGPTQLASADSVSEGDKVLWWGNSGGRQDLDALQRNEGYITRSDGRTAVMYSATPGVPGDSGSGVQAADGAAVGILNTVRFAPETGSNGVILLEPALVYAIQHGTFAELVTWEQFENGQLP